MHITMAMPDSAEEFFVSGLGDKDFYKSAAKRGMDLLDETIPDWKDELRPSKLVMHNSCWCILGQIMSGQGGDFMSFVSKNPDVYEKGVSHIPDKLLEGAKDNDQKEGIFYMYYGFDIIGNSFGMYLDHRGDYDTLQQVWEELLGVNEGQLKITYQHSD